jgi:hypothetical protein
MPLWQFFRKDELENDPSNWFAPSASAVLQAFESAGFQMKLLKNFGRGSFQGRVKKDVPEFLTIGSTEGGHYDSITSHLLGEKRLGLLSVNQNHLTSVLASEDFYDRCGEDDAIWLGRLSEHLLGRSPEAMELEVATRALREDYAGQREFLVSSLLLSMGPGAPLIAWYYRRLLGRAGTETEIQKWVHVLRQTSEEDVLAGFLGSDEYFVRNGRSNARWLEEVYRELLGSQVPEGAFLDGLNNGRITRNEIVLKLATDTTYCQRANRLAAEILGPAALASEEYYRTCGSPAEWVASIYTDVRGRSPEPSELEHALARLHEGYAAQRQVVVSGLIASPEYRRRQVARCYRDHLGRAGNSSEIRHWCELLDHCASEEEVLASFLSSEEYFSRHGKNTERWLDQVYKELLGRKADAFSKNGLSALEKNSARRHELLLTLVSSPEYQTRWVKHLYTTHLGRPATAREIASWTHVLRHRAKQGQVQAA